MSPMKVLNHHCQLINIGQLKIRRLLSVLHPAIKNRFSQNDAKSMEDAKFEEILHLFILSFAHIAKKR